jgi:L-2-hydroxyglutarate oxidase LhgO
MVEFCVDRGLPLHRVGKILVPIRLEDGPQLDVLAERGAANGVEFERIGSRRLAELEPEAESATGDALFVPGTSVVSPLKVMAALTREASALGIEIRCGGSLGKVDAGRRELVWAGETLSYGRAINAAGLHADQVAHRFGVGRRYTILPFKGIYWKLDLATDLKIRHLIYPVPDLRVPFLGIHTTTAIDGTVYLGPTAVPVFGRENYCGLEGVQAGEAIRIARLLGVQLLTDRDGFRRLAWHEGHRLGKHRFAAAARALLPRLRPEHLLRSDKVGIRAQLLDRKQGRLVHDFLVESGPSSAHVLNAISPAFTSAFPLARLVCDMLLS